jgi:hypothetical protein
MAGARNMLASNQAVQNAQGNTLYIIGWLMQILGFLGGAYAKNSWPGNTIRWIFELVPWDDFINAALIIWFAAWAIDIIWDLIPNQAAITFGFMGPILAVGQDGDLASNINAWTTTLQGAIGGKVESITGNLGTGTLAVICMAVAVIVGKRVLAKKGTGGGGGR